MTFSEYLSSLGYGPEITADVNDSGFYPESGGYYNIQDTGVDPWQIHQQWLAAQNTPEGVLAAQQGRYMPAIVPALNDATNQLVAGNAQAFDPQAFQSQLPADSAFNQLSPEDQKAALGYLSQSANKNLDTQNFISNYNANIGPSGFDWGAVAEMALPVAAMFAPELIGALSAGGSAGGLSAAEAAALDALSVPSLEAAAGGAGALAGGAGGIAAAEAAPAASAYTPEIQAALDSFSAAPLPAGDVTAAATGTATDAAAAGASSIDPSFAQRFADLQAAGYSSGPANPAGFLNAGVVPPPPPPPTLLESMMRGAGTSGLVAGITGQPILPAVATGGILGGAGSVIGSVTPGLTDSSMVNNALGSAAMGGVKAGLTGGDPAVGALSAATNSAINTGGGMALNAVKGALSPSDTGVTWGDQPTNTASANDWNIPPGTGMLASADTGTQTDAQQPFRIAPHPSNYADEYLAEVQRQQEQAANDLSVPSLETSQEEPTAEPNTAGANMGLFDSLFNTSGAFDTGGTPDMFGTGNPSGYGGMTGAATMWNGTNWIEPPNGNYGSTNGAYGSNTQIPLNAFNTSGAFNTQGTPDPYGINSAATGSVPPTDIFGTGGSQVNLGNSNFNQDGSINPNNQLAMTRYQNGTAAGLSGDALRSFVTSGGMMGSTVPGAGGVGPGGSSASQGGYGSAQASANPYATFNNYYYPQQAPAPVEDKSRQAPMDPSTMALFGAALGALGGSQTEPTIKSALPDWLTSQMASQAQPQPYTTQATQWGTQSMIPGQQANYMAGNQQQQNTINGNYLDPMKNPAIQGQLQALQDQFMTQTLPQTMGAAFRANPTGPMTDNSTFLNPSVGGGGMLNVAAQNLGRGYGQAVSQGYQQERTNQLGQTNNALATNPVGNAFGIQTANAAPLINYANATTGTGKNIFTGNPISGALTGAAGMASLFGNTSNTPGVSNGIQNLGSGLSRIFGNLFGSKIG